jgi:hypothetical protein
MCRDSMGVIKTRCTVTGSGHRVSTPYIDECPDSHLGCHCLCSPAVLNKAKKFVFSLRLKKRWRINCVMCEVRTEREEIVAHLVYSTAQQNELAESNR